jgi:hypothetical protein
MRLYRTQDAFGQIRAGIAIEALRLAAYPRRIVPARPEAALPSHLGVTQ